MTVLEIIRRSAEFLARKGVDSPRLQVELMLAQVLSLPRLKLYLDFERVLSAPQLEAVREMVRRRGARQPLQHILGSTSFCGFEIHVNRHVLIPRPETELLAEQGWLFLRKRFEEGMRSARVLDYGTGSGCLTVAVAKHCPFAQIDALDVSADALEMAKANAERNHVASQVRWLLTQCATNFEPTCRYDLVLSNPPYIPTHQIDQLQPEVRDHEPRLALDGGLDGLTFYRRLGADLASRTAPGGRMMVELGDNQSGPVDEIMRATGWTTEAVLKDYSSLPRILIASRPG